MKNLSKVGLSIIATMIGYLIFTSCKKENVFASEGIVFDRDYRKCASPCCSGFFIKIEKDTYRFVEIPTIDWDINSEKMPFKVQLNWEKTPKDCAKDLISVSKIVKVN